MVSRTPFFLSVFTDPPSEGWGLLLRKILTVFWPPLLLSICFIVAGLTVGMLKHKEWGSVQFVQNEVLIMAGAGVLAAFVKALKDMLRDSAAAARSDAEATKTAAFCKNELKRLTKLEEKPKLDALKRKLCPDFNVWMLFPSQLTLRETK